MTAKPPPVPEADLDCVKLGTRLAREADAVLGLEDREPAGEFDDKVIGALRRYDIEKFAKSLWSPPKEQKRRLTRLRARLVQAVADIGSLNSEYRVAIAECGRLPDDTESFSVLDVRNQMIRLSAGIEVFLARFEPPKGPPPNLALEGAVRILLPAVEARAGEETAIRWNKDSGQPPEPRSPSAIAIVQIVRGFPDPPSVTAILNMIRRVKHQPEQKLDGLDAVIRAQTDELDLSLLPGRHGDH